jgi:two-component system, NarL family, nitrate/nitrite response regulator NarL
MNVSATIGDRVDTVTTTKPIRVAVIGGDPISRKSVVRMLNGVEGIEVVAEGATSADGAKIAMELCPDVILLDVRLPRCGTEAAADIARVSPDVGTVVLTDSENEQDVGLALKAGARGYIVTSNSVREVVETVRAVVRRESREVPNLTSRLLIKSGERINTLISDNILDFGLPQKANRPAHEE